MKPCKYRGIHRAVLCLISFFLGIALVKVSLVLIDLYTSPSPADIHNWDRFYAQYKAGNVTDIRVYPDQQLIQYRVGEYDTWHSVDKGSHNMSNFSNTTYMDKVSAGMTHIVVFTFLVLGPLIAVSAQSTSRKASCHTVRRPGRETTKGKKQTVRSQQPHPRPGSTELTMGPTISIVARTRETTTFEDIAGYTKIKENLQFVVHCLKNPRLLRQVGAKIPTGILFYGPPGTGKTLLAKAVAGTAGVSFYSISASDFVNVWVGQGANNIRHLYAEARANAPSVVFIDEIDAIGSRETDGLHQEYRQTLNALLTELDGIDKNSGVLTIAATNDFRHLDSALTRSGRFDRRIKVPLPSTEERLDIIRYHARGRKLSPKISLERLSMDTAGMTGSDIATLLNEAAIRAVCARRDTIYRADIDEALTQLLTDGEISKATNEKDLTVAAYHEAGHAIILRLLCNDRVPKNTIVGNTNGAVGLTLRTEGESRRLIPISQIKNHIIAYYGGIAAEELIFGRSEVTTGASQDIKEASFWIREYLRYESAHGLLDEESFTGHPYSESRLKEAQKLSKELYCMSKQFLLDHRGLLQCVAQTLIHKDTILEDGFDQLIAQEKLTSTPAAG